MLGTALAYAVPMNRDQTRVLVIDDEPSVRKVLRDILATFGFQTDAVGDGPAGIEQFVSTAITWWSPIC